MKELKLISDELSQLSGNQIKGVLSHFDKHQLLALNLWISQLLLQKFPSPKVHDSI